MDFDLFVIGTGAAGMAAAIQGAELGARVGIAESGTLGGTCVNIGCIPSKNLIESAAHYHAMRRGFPGIAACDPSLDWSAILAQKDALVGSACSAAAFESGMWSIAAQSRTVDVSQLSCGA